jgi:hypothetical protein
MDTIEISSTSENVNSLSGEFTPWHLWFPALSPERAKGRGTELVRNRAVSDLAPEARVRYPFLS